MTKRSTNFFGEINRRDLLLGSAYVLVAPVLGGCAGMFGAGPGAAGSQVFHGSVTLPTGVSPTAVTVVAGLGESPITGGSFSVSGLSTIPTLASVIDNATKKVIMLVMLDPTQPTQSLDPNNVAATMVFLALGGSQLPQNRRASFLAMVRANSSTATFAGVIASQLNSDPFALMNGNSAIKTALATAVASYTPPVRSAARVANSSSSSVAHPATTTNEHTFAVHGKKIYGDFLSPYQVTTPSVPVQATNQTLAEQRFTLFYVGSKNLSGVRQDLQSAQAVMSDTEIPKASAATADGALNYGVLNFNVAPHSNPSSVASDYFGFVRIFPLFDSTDPAFFTDNRYAANVAVWRLTLEDMYARAQVQVVAQYLIEAMGLGCPSDTPTLQKGVQSFAAIGSQEASLIQTAKTGTGLIASTKQFLLNASASDPNAQAYINAIQTGFGLNLPDNATIRIANLRGAILIFNATGIFDSSVLLGELVTALTSKADAFSDPTSCGYLNEAEFAYNGLLITPPTGSYQPGGADVIISVPSSFGDPAIFTLRWVLTGINCVISDGVHTGADFTTNSTQVKLTTTPSTAGTVLVRCDLIRNSTQAVVDSATSTLTPLVPPPTGSITLDAPQQNGVQSNTGAWDLYGTPGQKSIIYPNNLNNYRLQLGFGDAVYGQYPGSAGTPPWHGTYSSGNFAVTIDTHTGGAGFTQGQVINIPANGITIGQITNAAPAQMTVTAVAGKEVSFTLNCTLNNNFDPSFTNDATFALTSSGKFVLP